MSFSAYDVVLPALHSNFSCNFLTCEQSGLVSACALVVANEHNIKKITLLIIPGLEWNDEQIKIFNEWENNQNIELASHGWIHESNPIKSIYHYFHSKLISDDCAEHLSLSKTLIIKLMKNSYSWFIDRGLTPPTLYVPPAWALGNINKKDLLKVPFNEIETICGVYISNKFIFIPLIGFETKNYFK